MNLEQMKAIWHEGTWEQAVFTWDEASFPWEPQQTYQGVKVPPSETNRPVGIGTPGGR